MQSGMTVFVVMKEAHCHDCESELRDEVDQICSSQEAAEQWIVERKASGFDEDFNVETWEVEDVPGAG